MKRRDILQAGALAGLSMVQIGQRGWCARADDRSAQLAAGKRLIVVFLRGAVDGLNVVAPYAEADYKRLRPTIGLAAPGTADGVLDLDGHFGLHPSLSALMPLWQAGKLGFVHASGSPDTTRSHFDAQDYMESGTPGRKATQDGWLNRLLGVLPASAQASSSARAVSVGAVLPRIYAGRQAIANIPSGAAATKPTLLDRPRIGDAFAQLYGGDDKLSKAYQASQQSHREVMASMTQGDLDQEMQAANNGAPLPNGFADDAARLGTLMRKDAGVQLAFMAVGGWDTHANQGAGTGQLASRLTPLGQGLAALTQRLGPVLDDTVVLVMSEFGRTAHQNGNGGTDHGHGNVMWLLGGGVRGGQVHGAWPGLDDQALYEGRDLAVTTDFRQVLADVLSAHLRLKDAQLSQVLPGYAAGPVGRLHLLNA